MPDDPALRIFPDEFVPNVEASDAYKRWAKSSPADKARWTAFRDSLLAGQTLVIPPGMSTKFGKALVAAGKEHMSITHFVGTPTNPYPPKPPGGVSHITGTHFPGTSWGDTSSFASIASIPLSFVVFTVNPAATNGEIGAILDAAEAVNLKVVIGLYGFGTPTEPWTISGDYTPHDFNNHPAINVATDRRTAGVWTFSANTIRVLNYLQTRRNIIFAFFGFNEPYFQDQWTGAGDVCGALSAKNLRDFRTEVHNYMPGVAVWHDLGWPSEWAPPTSANPNPGIYNAAVDLRTYGFYADVSGTCDYMGCYDYPFRTGGIYNRAQGLATAHREIDYALEVGLTPAFLMQSFGGVEGNRYPTDAEILDWNRAIRTEFAYVPNMPLSWYTWYLSLYPDPGLRDHPTQWPLTIAGA